jgi:hypothetical protein
MRPEPTPQRRLAFVQGSEANFAYLLANSRLGILLVAERAAISYNLPGARRGFPDISVCRKIGGVWLDLRPGGYRPGPKEPTFSRPPNVLEWALWESVRSQTRQNCRS